MITFYFLFRKEEVVSDVVLRNKYIKAIFNDVFLDKSEPGYEDLLKVYRGFVTDLFLKQFRINPESGSIVVFSEDEWNRCHTAELICFATMNCYNKTVYIEEGKTDSEYVTEVVFSHLTGNN